MKTDQLNPEVRARICTHMNNDHQDALIELARHYGKAKMATTAQMLDLTPIAMKLRADGEVIEIGFEHKLNDSADAHRSIVKLLKEIPKSSATEQEQ